MPLRPRPGFPEASKEAPMETRGKRTTAQAGRLSEEGGGSYYHLIRANRIKFLEIFFSEMLKKMG